MILFFVLFVLYKIGEYLYDTFEQVDKSNSKKLCRCGPFRALFTSCCKKMDTAIFTNVNDADSEEQRLRRQSTPFTKEDRFSKNIYEELTMEDLKREYMKTQVDKQSYHDGLKSGTLTDSPAVKHVIERLGENLVMIETLIEKYCKEARLTPDQASTTLDKFDALFERYKADPRQRLKA